jgi:hypothetical protein
LVTFADAYRRRALMLSRRASTAAEDESSLRVELSVRTSLDAGLTTPELPCCCGSRRLSDMLMLPVDRRLELESRVGDSRWSEDIPDIGASIS